MVNPILERLSQSRQQTQQNNVPRNPLELKQQFDRFIQEMAGKNPQEIVMGLLSSGKMSQQQFEQLKRQAQELQKFLK